MKLYIKNMVCNRCKTAVKAEVEKLGLTPVAVELGEVDIKENDITAVKDSLQQNLHCLGFELIDNKKSRTIEKIKNLIVDLVQNKSNEIDIKLSDYLTQHLLQDYSTLSTLFSETENTTIEKYYISQRIEKVKELLIYNELTLSEIAFELNYSSVAHLSNQFKKVTGFSPSYFKQLKDRKRKQIDKI